MACADLPAVRNKGIGQRYGLPALAGWLLRACLAGLILAWAVPATASEAGIASVSPVVREGELYVDANIELDLTSELHTAVSRGIPLHFSLDVEIVRRRWWWFDQVVAQKRRTWRVMYNALTRQWRVATGELSLPESSLEDALSRIRSVRGWAVADLDALDHDVTYTGRIRLRLDTSRLARPFQIDALNSSAWSLATPWTDFSFSISKDDFQH